MDALDEELATLQERTGFLEEVSFTKTMDPIISLHGGHIDNLILPLFISDTKYHAYNF